MEVWDVLDHEGARTGRTAVRGDALPDGEFHLVVHVWIRNESGQYLIQRRADDLEWQPGVWATTGGSVLAGEESRDGAVRETLEELGLQLEASRLTLMERYTNEDAIVDLWLTEIREDAMDACTLGPEVSEFDWATKHELQLRAGQGEFFPYSYLARLPE